jgi:hypothetical protein
MAEHTDVFLWNLSPDRDPRDDDYVVRPADLGVPEELIERLAAWNIRFSRLALDLDPGWDDPAVRGAWQREGLELAHALQDALGADVDVLYDDYSGDGGRLIRVRGD